MSSGSVIVQFGVRASAMRVTAPSSPTIQTLRGAQSRSTYQTFSGSGISWLSAPFFQPVTASEPQMTAGPSPQDGSRVRMIGASARARLVRVHLAAVDHALLEDVGVQSLAGLRLAAGVGVPGVVFPGRLFREAVVGVVAGLEVDVADRLARLELEGLRRPLQIAGRQHLRVRLLPGPGSRVLGIHDAMHCDQQGQDANAAFYGTACRNYVFTPATTRDVSM